MKVLVSYSSYCNRSWVEDSDDPYRSWEEDYSSSITDVVKVDDDHKSRYSEDIFQVEEESTTVWVMHMIYSTGNSFGHSSGNIDVMGCWGNEEKAKAAFEAAKVAIEKEEFSIKTIDDFDREISICNSAAGYFESCEGLYLEAYNIEGDKGKHAWKPNM